MHGFINSTLDRQLLGLSDTAALTATLIAYLVFLAAPPYVMSRKSAYHPVWRGLESFIIYVAVAIILGAIFAAGQSDDWSTFSAISAGGVAWARIGSVVVLLGVFVFASWLGSTTSSGRHRRVKAGKRVKGGSDTGSS
jgi:hypothetical protein